MERNLADVITAYRTYLARIGIHSQIARLQASSDEFYQRGDMVLCRTTRGVELGELLAEANLSASQSVDLIECDGKLLRRAAPEELYLHGELKKIAASYVEEAATAIKGVDESAVLLEVETMLDCQTVYFHFLGDVSDRVHRLVDELAHRFQQSVQNSRLAELLENGCGPGCGTADHGCGSGGCKGCAVAQACGTKKRA